MPERRARPFKLRSWSFQSPLMRPSLAAPTFRFSALAVEPRPASRKALRAMSDHFQTPFPTESSRSQVFVLKTTRPTSGGQLSPGPKVGLSKPASKRVYARKKAIRHSASSRNLKENSSYSRSGPGLDDGVVNLRTKLRARRTTSFASLKDQRTGGKSDKARLSNFKSPSQVSLASPFCSRPASPDHGEEPPQLAPTAKRTLAIGESGDMEYSLPVCKRRNSNTLGAVLPSPIPFRPSHSPALRKTSKKPPTGNGGLHRRPSHPTLGVEGLAERGDDRGFLLRSSPIDFNRPPSQLSLYAPLDGDDEDEALGQRPLVTGDPWVYDKRFEDDLQDASTPNKRDPGLQHMSLELLSSSPRAALTTYNTEVRQSPALEDHTLNMSLTSVEDNHLTEADLANRSPWISDSLISPPSIYLRQEQAHGGHGTSSPVYADKLSETLRTGFGEGDEIHDIELDANVSKKADGKTAITRDAIPAETGGPRQTFGRTRSGTIVSAAPAASSSATGRSRSGTITAAPAAIKQGRGRSGTITQSSAVEMKPMVVTGRSRSGTITASRPQVSTVASLAPISDSGLSGPEAHAEILAPEVDVLVDAHYDPTAGEDLVFSSAPNPDMEAESDDEVVLGRHSVILSPARAPSTSLKPPLSSPTDPLNIDTTKAAVNLDRAWEDAEAKVAGKKPLAKRSGSKKTDSKGSRKLNLKSLGFNSNRRGRKYEPAGETRNEPSPEREEIAALSSDPMDLLHDFDQQAFEGPPKKRTSRAGKVKFAAPRL